MKSRLRLLCLLLPLLPACALPGGAAWSGAHLNAGLGTFAATMDGSVQTVNKTGPPVTGTFDVDQVGQGDRQFLAFGQARLGFAPLEIGLSFFDYSQTGTGTGGITFLGTNFTSNVRSDFQIRGVQGTVGLDVFNSEWVRVGVLAGVDFLDVDLRVDGTAGGITTSQRIDESLPVPVVGLRADVGIIPNLRVGGQVVGLDLNVSDYDARLVDWELGLHWSPFPVVEVFAGYRDMSIQFAGPLDSNNDVDVDVGLSGPFLGVGVSF